MPRRAHLIGALLIAAIALGGCGAPQPQPPTPQANVLSQSLTAIAADCGESYQGGPSPTLEADATRQGAELAMVFRRNPGWIYQGATVAQIVSNSVSYLDDCQLRAAARALESETA